MGRDASSFAISTSQTVNLAPSHAPSLPTASRVEDIREFFKYRPPTLVKAVGHTQSESTRAPADFDRHFDQSLRLRHIEYLPSITGDLEKIAEEALDAACQAGSLPADNEGFPAPDIRDAAFDNAPTDEITAELPVQQIYSQTTAAFCACVAATLEFQLPTWSSGCFAYKQIDSDKKQGIADGFLRIDKDAQTDPNVGGTFPVIAIWEFKNLNFCKRLKMEAILQLANDDGFFWEGCEHGKLCIVHHKALPGESMVTGHKMGFDAQSQQCVRPGMGSMAQLDPSSAPLKDSDKQKARYIMQQVWAEAVHDDATFLIINTGNLELIGIRDRESQTLYLSDIIEVDNCDYGKLHTGLFVAAYRDAKDRSSRLLSAKTIPPSWSRTYNRSFADLTKSKGDVTIKTILENAQKRDWLAIHAPKSSLIDSYVSETCYIRKNASRSVVDQDLPDIYASFLRIHIIGLIKPGVNRGLLEIDGVRQRQSKRPHSGGVVLKHASKPASIDRLNHEYKVYHTLQKAQVAGIPKIIGIFEYANIEGNFQLVWPYVTLIMENAGTPVAHLGEDFSRGHLAAFMKVLRAIHENDYVHGDLNKDNLLIRDKFEGVSIVGFGSARQTKDLQEKQEECERLERFWSNPLKRGEDGDHTKDFKEKFAIAKLVPPLHASLNAVQNLNPQPGKRVKKVH